MPELPEVHTTVTGLNAVLPGLVITDVWTGWPKQIKGHNFKDFKKLLIGKKFLSVSRQAKNVLIHLSGGMTLRVHMKMTGQLLFDRPNSKYIHQRFFLSKGHELSFSDLRKFGRVELIETSKLHEHETLKTLGPDPFDKKLTLKVLLARLLRRPNLPIKLALLDQTIISGIGNIYADESLWDAGIIPTRKAKDVSPAESGAILKSMRKILTKSIKLGGDSKSDYRNIYGEKGGFQNHHMAYRMTGEACKKKGCGGIIKRIVLGSRSTHFCPKHQH
ncbi:MAG: bifunctional DNA-formamidopyrimidine glycosylase/DNA-(apurinic or apyrimidinic site) lyase [Candidatus Paceibacterota bacterium]|jgi:formamidopyrimidine-DNA glycosylase